MTYLITYDLKKPGQNYNELYDQIKKISSKWCHPLDSTWFIVTNYTATQIRDSLHAIDATDALIVAQASAPAAWIGLSDTLNQWLKDNL